VTRTLIRVEGEVSEEVSSAFPHLVSRYQRASTALVGDIVDQQELQGVLNLLNALGIDVIEVVTIPDE
jgi:hypothetical protein